MSAAGIFGNAELEAAANAAALELQREICLDTSALGFGSLAQAIKERARLADTVLADARWALGLIRDNVYTQIEACDEFKKQANEFVKRFPALSRQAASGLILAPA